MNRQLDFAKLMANFTQGILRYPEPFGSQGSTQNLRGKKEGVKGEHKVPAILIISFFIINI